MYVKILHFVLSFLLFVSCSPSHDAAMSSWMREGGKKKILCTTSFIQNLVDRVGGDAVDAISLINGELDPHSYQLVKGDDEKLLRADLIFYNGLGLEHGPNLYHFLVHSDKSISLGDSIAKQHPESIIYLDGAVDPHIWMDVSLWKKAVPYICDELSKHIPEKKELFQKNAQELTSELDALHLFMKKTLLAIPKEKRYLVTTHDAFHYFVRAYLAEPDEISDGSWTERCAAPEGLAPDSQLSTADIQRLVQYIAKHHVSIVFAESNVSRDSIKKLVSACQGYGDKVHISPQVLYADALGKKGSDAESYQKMMQHDAITITKELQP
jgi:manganese/zinc/iron transport system substrate-binding protein